MFPKNFPYTPTYTKKETNKNLTQKTNLMKKLLFVLAFALSISSTKVLAQSDTSKTIDKKIVNSNILRISPNPSNGTFIVMVTNATTHTEISVTVYDTIGNIVHEASGTGNTAIVDIRTQPVGVYMLYVSGEGFMDRQKIIITK